MKEQEFRENLPTFYHNWGTSHVIPKSVCFQEIINQIPSKIHPNVMQLLNWAINCIDKGEVYCEIGCFPGTSLIAALQNNPHCYAYAVDSSAQEENIIERAEIFTQTLCQYQLDDHVIFCQQNFEAFFINLRELQSEDKIGVLYLSNAYSDYRAVLLSLLFAQEFVAEKSLIIIGNSHQIPVHQAILDFITISPYCQVLFDFSTPELRDDWDGLLILNLDKNYDNSGEKCQKIRHQTFIQNLTNFCLAQSQESQVIAQLYQEAQELQNSGNLIEAEAKYDQLIKLNSQDAEALYQLGVIYYITERLPDAKNILTQSLVLDSSNFNIYYILGLVYEKLGDFSTAIRHYQETINLNDHFIDAYNNLGNIFSQLGLITQAELTYKQAIEVNPNHYGSYINLGNLLLKQELLEDSIASYERAYQLNPNNGEIHQALEVLYLLQNDQIQRYLYFGNDYYQRENYSKAIFYYQQIPETSLTAEIFLNLAHAYQHLQHYPDAIALCQKAIARYPNVEGLYHCLVSLYIETGETQEAIALSRQASQLFPNNLTWQFRHHLILPIFYNTTAEIINYRENFTQGITALIAQTPLETITGQQQALTFISQHSNFFLSYQGKNDLALQKQYGEFVHQVMKINYPQWAQPLEMPPLSHKQKIRIGYISGCFWSHTVGKLTLGWFRHHNSNDFEIYCYQITETQDALTQQFRQYSDRFYYIPHNLEKVCQQILHDQLHILVFIDLGQQIQMTQMAALKLAPIQCTTWAHPITSGLPTVDYFLSSELMEPPQAQNHYSETLITLPNIGIAYPQPTPPPITLSRSHFKLRENAIVYLCCQLLSKYLPQYDDILAEIARKVPQAQFAFIARPNIAIGQKFQQRLQRAFAKVGLNSEDYCVIIPLQDQIGYGNLFLLSDIFLDSFAWSGGQTTLDAIACHLPVVTCAGEFMRGRHSYGILTRLGITETIAQQEREYIEIAIKLGIEADWREKIVDKIIKHSATLYDDKTCVTALEDFYRKILSSKREP